MLTFATAAPAAATLPLFLPQAPPDKISGLIHAAILLSQLLAQGRAIDSRALRSAMENAFCGTDADGAWVWKDAYEACEAAQVMFLRKFGIAMRTRAGSAPAMLDMLMRLAGRLPMQTRRSEESEQFQQFSTPIALGFVASEAAAITATDLVLEPSENAVIWAERRSKYLSSQKNTAIGAGLRQQTNQLPYVEFLTERRLPEKLREKDAEGFDLAIIDTPPAAGPQAVAAAQEAGLILIPCGTDLIDIDAIRRTALLVKTVTTPAFVVFSAVPPGATVLLEDARALIRTTKRPPRNRTCCAARAKRLSGRLAERPGRDRNRIAGQGSGRNNSFAKVGF